jgi:hypothetical protein
MRRGIDGEKNKLLKMKKLENRDILERVELWLHPDILHNINVLAAKTNISRKAYMENIITTYSNKNPNESARKKK